jgi:hypothetical protein
MLSAMPASDVKERLGGSSGYVEVRVPRTSDSGPKTGYHGSTSGLLTTVY